METVLLIVALIIGALALVVGMVIMRALGDLRKALSQLEGSIKRIDGRLSDQEDQVELLMRMRSKPAANSDSTMGLLQLALGMKQNGPLPTLGLLGLKAFQAYLSKRRAINKASKALPARNHHE